MFLGSKPRIHHDRARASFTQLNRVPDRKVSRQTAFALKFAIKSFGVSILKNGIVEKNHTAGLWAAVGRPVIDANHDAGGKGRGWPSGEFVIPRYRTHDHEESSENHAGGTYPSGNRKRRGRWLLNLNHAHTRKIAPSFFPRSRLIPTMVTPKNTIAQTPRALAMNLPSPSNWKSSMIALVIG